MISEETIYGEIRKFVADRIDSGIITPVDWIANAFLSSRADISGADAALYKTCTHAHIQKIVKRVVGKYDTEARTTQDAQIALDGFEHLQRAYTVDRDERVVLVPIGKLTSKELLLRAAEYDKMAVSCRAHAREIRDFVSQRAEVAAA